MVLISMVAPLGNKENKGEFIRSQPPLPEELPSWQSEEVQDAQKKVDTASRQLDTVFSLQNDLAVKRQELEAASLEWEHFKQEHALGEEDARESTSLTSGKLLRLCWSFSLMWMKMLLPVFMAGADDSGGFC